MIVHMISNAHIDPVWLWGWQAGADEVLATFRSAADRCDEYPEFTFTAGEAWRYATVEEVDPALFDRIVKLVHEGRWHVTGGQWIQPDCNLPTARGMLKQYEIGGHYFRERFDVTSFVGFNVDSFGHPATLPDTLRQAGCSAYVFCRPDPDQLVLPANVFRWRGEGGGEVTAFRMVPTYVTRSASLLGQVLLAVESALAELGHTMCFYGVGNHGGGPTKGQIEWIRDNRNPLPGVELRFSTPAAFFDTIRDRVPDLPLVTGELQHVFPGCYSVMHDIKQAQRHGEHTLQQAERVLDIFSPGAPDTAAARQGLTAAWTDLSFTAFHDILAGTSAPSAWPSVRARQGRARIAGEEIIYRSTRRWARLRLPPVNEVQVVAINPDPEPWEGVVECEPWLDTDPWGDRWVSDENGRPLPFQLVQPETPSGLTRLLFPAIVPPGGAVQVQLRGAPKPAAPAADPDLVASRTRIANSRVALGLGRAGITSVEFDGMEVLGDGGVSLHLRKDLSDTWVFHSDNLPGRVVAAIDNLVWVVEESGPLRARVRAEARLGHSDVRWTIDAIAGEAGVRVRLEVNFAERHRALQMPTILASAPTGWLDGQAGGRVNRDKGTAEWPVQGWSRVTTPAVQLAWITQDAYSISLRRNRWQWTLLRSPRMGWSGDDPGLYSGRNWYTDQGPHQFDFILRCGAELMPLDLDRTARQVVQPPVVFDRYEGLDRPPWGDVAPRNAWTAAEGREERHRAGD